MNKAAKYYKKKQYKVPYNSKNAFFCRIFCYILQKTALL